ncbi:ABC transporter ATP-binding protein [Paenibacillus yanchengensis]|uniref:ABC transporter ATP-binding protein n=1 Tax=Paenibacillus yanchengensis TaxID=2035833 RepID=A0ABW4YIS9_9BACL
MEDTATVPAVSVQQLCKSYSQDGYSQQVLHGVNVEIKEGEIVSLLGQSGCGKSTLLSIIGGFEQGDSGVVRIGGQLVTKPGRHCVMLFQSYGLLPWRSVRSNVELALHGMSLTKQEISDRAAHYISLVGLQDRMTAFPAQLSGGMQQRTALARALVMQPKLLLMDEPFAALDTFTKYALQDELLRIQQQEKVTIILVTHDIDEAITLSHRVLIMQATPGTITATIPIVAPKPFDRGDADFQHYRKRILSLFRLSGTKQVEEFVI